MSERIEHIMIEFFKGLDLLGPADPASTSRALARVAPQADAVVVDVGCGTGRQTLQLLRETSTAITATDMHQPFLDRMRQQAERLGLAHRLRTMQADMNALPLSPTSVDLIWCEGAIYSMGYEQGLRAWKPLLRPRGHLCVTEAAYLVDDPPAEVKEFWEAEYPAITTRAQLELIARGCGYDLVESFQLPRSAWEAYYGPVERRLDELAGTYADNPEWRQVLTAMRHEVDVFHRHGDTYGYVFLVLQKPAE